MIEMPRGTETRKNPQLYCTALQTMLQFTNMNMNSPVEEIKSRINIVDLVGSYVRLTKAGANFKALCPFHTERTASFNVSPARQIWHCFGCSKGGDAFRFIMEIEGMDFPEALKFLAERTGVVLKREDPAIRSERNRLLVLMEETAKFFEANLAIGLLSSNPIAQYLRDRGLKDETIKEFRLGYASNEWRALSTYLAAKGFTAIEMEKAGLAVGRRQTWTVMTDFAAALCFRFLTIRGVLSHSAAGFFRSAKMRQNISIRPKRFSIRKVKCSTGCMLLRTTFSRVDRQWWLRVIWI